MSSHILVAVLESEGPGGNPALALPFSLPKIEARALGDSPSASWHVHIWRWRNVQKVILSQILVKRQPWQGSVNMLAWDRGKSLKGLSLSQFTCTHMAVNKCWEGYTSSWNFHRATLSQILVRDPLLTLHIKWEMFKMFFLKPWTEIKSLKI